MVGGEATGAPPVMPERGASTDIIRAFREYCAQQRKFLVHERETAATPEAKLLRVGELRMLNNVENQLIQLGTSIARRPAPTTFPRSFDELSAVLLDYFDLPRSFSVRDLLNDRWRFAAIKAHPGQKGPLLTLNKFARNRDLVDALLDILCSTCLLPSSPPAPEPQVVPLPAPAAPTPLAPIVPPSPSPGPKIALKPPPNQPGRKAGMTFGEVFRSRCGRVFKYRKALENHEGTCRDCAPGQVEGARFACPCGKVFKYEGAFRNHQETCPKKATSKDTRRIQISD